MTTESKTTPCRWRGCGSPSKTGLCDACRGQIASAGEGLTGLFADVEEAGPLAIARAIVGQMDMAAAVAARPFGPEAIENVASQMMMIAQALLILADQRRQAVS